MLTRNRQGRPYPDPLVKIYDLRNMKALPPIPFSAGPAFINRFPNRPSTLAITSNQGLVQIVDTTNPTSNEFYQVCRSTLFRGTLLDTAVSSTRHHSSVQWRFLRPLRTWLSGIQMAPCIYCPLPKTKLCCRLTGSRANRSTGRMPRNPCRRSSGRSRRKRSCTLYSRVLTLTRRIQSFEYDWNAVLRLTSALVVDE